VAISANEPHHEPHHELHHEPHRQEKRSQEQATLPSALSPLLGVTSTTEQNAPVDSGDIIESVVNYGGSD
jgi:hypothetical protein